MACFEDQILEYASGNLSAQEAERVKGHITYCPKCSEYYANLAKLDSALGAWSQSGSFGDEFDNRLIIACEDRLAKREFIRDIIKPSLKYVYYAAAAVFLLFLYRATLYDETSGTFSAVRASSITCETELKDVNIYLSQKLMNGLLENELDFGTLSNADAIMNIPEAGPVEERVSDVKALLKDAVNDRRSKRFFLFRLADSTLLFLEQAINLKPVFAAGAGFFAPRSDFNKATEYMDKRDFEKALEEYTDALKSPLPENETRSAEFRLGFLNDIAGNYAEAAKYYDLVQEKSNGTVEALLVPDMKRFSVVRRGLDAAAEKETARIEAGKDNAATFYIIGNARMLHLDFDGAAEAYNNCINKFYGLNRKRSKINLAWCFKAKGDYKSAIKLYEKFGDISPDHRIYGEYEMSLAYMRLGDFERARNVVSRETRAEFPDAYKKLIDKYFKEINKEEPKNKKK